MIIDGTTIKPTDPMVPHCGTCGRPSRVCGNCKADRRPSTVDSQIIAQMVKEAQQHADKAQR